MLLGNCPSCPFSPLFPVLAELHQADLVNAKECKGLYGPNDVVRVQSCKSSEVKAKTADVLRRHAFEKESIFLTGKQIRPLIHVPVVCCTVGPSCKGHLKASIILVFHAHNAGSY